MRCETGKVVKTFSKERAPTVIEGALSFFLVRKNLFGLVSIYTKSLTGSSSKAFNVCKNAEPVAPSTTL